MKFTLDNPQGEYVFGSYGDGQLKINDQVFTSSLIIFPDQIIEDWQVSNIADLQLQHLEAFKQRRPDIAILGTGRSQIFPAVEIRRQLAAENLQIDVMDTAAACRTYNLLVSEGRNVGAAMLVF